MSFKSVQNKIAKKEGVSEDRAGAILAAGTRKASRKAREENPKLNKVSGMPSMEHAPEHRHHYEGREISPEEVHAMQHGRRK